MRENAPAPTAHEAPSECWTIQQAAAYLNVHRRFIERRIADGSLTAYKLAGYVVRLDADQVRSLLAPAGGAR